MVPILIIFSFLSIVPEAVRSGEGIYDMEGYFTHEEWRVNPQDYIDCDELSRGKAVYIEGDETSYWQLYLVDQQEIRIVSQLTGEVVSYHHGFNCDEIRFSPNAAYCLLVNRQREECARIDLSTGDMVLFRPYDERHPTGTRPMMARISDCGSMLFLSDRELRILDAELHLIAESNDQFPMNPSVSYSQHGDFFCLTNGDHIDAYDEDGLAWSIPARVIPSHNLWGRVYVTPDGRWTLACVSDKSQILLLDNATGRVQETIYLDGALYRHIYFSPNSMLAIYNSIDPEMDSDLVPETCELLVLGQSGDIKTSSISYSYDRSWGLWTHRPLAVADNGNSLWLFSNRPGFYRLILYSSGFDCISASGWITSHSTIPEFGFSSSLLIEGNGYCTFDGCELVFFSLMPD
ncbi:MAG: hypothetical protein AVO35_10925 [Candidatus Aegiribacteria sp. MLS_C]|nr:MAG: hypothetical protein AVO35_10925 [Candidatus Aegiribacteria sp. MLS_C]